LQAITGAARSANATGRSRRRHRNTTPTNSSGLSAPSCSPVIVKAVHSVSIAGQGSPLAPAKHAMSTAHTQTKKKSIVLKPEDMPASATNGHTAKYG
jgi:hypothetical protein